MAAFTSFLASSSSFFSNTRLELFFLSIAYSASSPALLLRSKCLPSGTSSAEILLSFFSAILFVSTMPSNVHNSFCLFGFAFSVCAAALFVLLILQSGLVTVFLASCSATPCSPAFSCALLNTRPVFSSFEHSSVLDFFAFNSDTFAALRYSLIIPMTARSIYFTLCLCPLLISIFRYYSH
ncbi:hypothetical protein NEAUS06_1035 [Nematocida ausubeli]|nr:hypothetical protein NEAUS06_1035 [Nematocida ausubeli]